MVDFAVNAGMITEADETVTDAIETASELGVDAIEFLDLESADVEAVRQASETHGVAIACTFAAGSGFNIDDRSEPAMVNPHDHDAVVDDIERSIEAADAVGADSLALTVGPSHGGLDRTTQRRAVERVLREIAPAADAADVTAIVEPLNEKVDHPGYFLSASQEAFDVVRSVDSSHVKVLFDVYHQQITEGDVIRTLTGNIDAVGHVHVADNPGRNEPGTGEIDYPAVLGAIDDTGYEGYVGMEFSPSEGTSAFDAVRSTLELG